MGVKLNMKTISLSGRERALLQLLSEGRTPQSIAQVAGVANSTVYNQLHSALTKLQVRSYEKGVKKAERLGLLNETVRT